MSNLVIALLYGLIGALTFRIRGGLRIPFTNKKFPLNKWFFAVWFACETCLLKGYNYQLAITSLIAGYICTAISGWGSYIGALYSGNISKTDKDDLNITDFVQNDLFLWFDKAHNWCLNSKYFKWLAKLFPAGGYQEHGHLYGFWCLTFRGGYTTFILGLAVNSILYCCVGLLQGLVYSLGGLIGKKWLKIEGKFSWNLSEIFWGFTLCFLLPYCLRLI